MLQPLGIPVAAWLGISYLLFRLLHVLLESRHNQLPDLKLGEMIVYALFPASFIAGPIDRFPRFKSDLDQVDQPFRFNFVADGAWLILIGAFKKFVIADFLAQAAAGHLAQYPSSTPAPYLWLALYGYGFLLYFDFSGYTDMAIGVARLIGFHLPENFNAPYLKTNLARFWQAWHITLSSWARDYVFLPLARTLRMRAEWLPANGAALHLPSRAPCSSSACGTASRGRLSRGACGMAWDCSSSSCGAIGVVRAPDGPSPPADRAGDAARAGLSPSTSSCWAGCSFKRAIYRSP